MALPARFEEAIMFHFQVSILTVVLSWMLMMMMKMHLDCFQVFHFQLH
jgi:hypothetical protein